MDFNENPEEARFRAEVRAWLEANAPEPEAEGSLTGGLSDAFSDDEAEHVKRAKDWQRTLYDAGWAGITWPKEFGGRGGNPIEAAIFAEEEAKVAAPAGIFAVGIGMAGPTLISHGTEAQKQRFLDPMLRGDEVWCQLFSEPGAGSDLAGLATRAERDGDEFVVNGQKVWTSGAHYSDWGILLARTNPDAPKHRGITYFVVDMSTPGIEVRPLRQITGAAHFNEVFLTDVRVPAGQVIGEVDDGWRVTMTTLTNERSLIGGGGGGNDLFADLHSTAQRRGRTNDRLVRQELARAYTHLRIMSYLGMRARTALSQGLPPGPETSVMKLAYSVNSARYANLAMAIQQSWGMLAEGDQDVQRWHDYFLGHWASRIGGGTDQVQRNVIGERVLGLPGDIRVDKDRPFREVARSASGTR
ncbi:MAG: acyl-CoA dehydrogenase family protein [Acidimicrobiales bacterium]|nr:acyl-CoA dehydrogenase family protein [Acidimicrobiales bacterium]